MNNILSFVGLLLCVVTTIFSTCALLINLWQVYENSNTKIKTGLFEVCVETTDASETCRTLDDFVTDEKKRNLKVVRYTIYSAMGFLISSVICALLNVTTMRKRKNVGYMASGFAFVAGVFLLIAFAYYAVTLEEREYDYHVTFAFTVIGWIFSWAAGVLFFSEKYITKA